VKFIELIARVQLPDGFHRSVDQAAANLGYEREQIVTIDSNGAVAKAQVDSANAALLSTKFLLDDTEICMPIAGVVASRKTRVGEYATASAHMLSIDLASPPGVR
jgi:membrane fusion protein, multidrug efflux system